MGSEIIYYNFSLDLMKLALLTADNRIILLHLLPILAMQPAPATTGAPIKREIKDFSVFFNSMISHKFRKIEFSINGSLLMAVSEKNHVYFFDSTLYAFKLLNIKTHSLLNFLTLAVLPDLGNYDHSTNKALSQLLKKKAEEFKEELMFYTCNGVELFEEHNEGEEEHVENEGKSETGTQKEEKENSIADLPFILASCGGALFFYKMEAQMQFVEREAKGSSLLNQYTLISIHLSSANFITALKLLTNVLEPELWLQSFLHVGNSLLRNIQVLKTKVIIQELLKMYHIILHNPDFDYFIHTINYYYSKFGFKLLAFDYFEKAFRVAMAIKSAFLLKFIHFYAKHKNKLTLSLFCKNEACKLDQSN